jgi:phage/conjugal plasmid C-4 type zinc finger TraR family protein
LADAVDEAQLISDAELAASLAIARGQGHRPRSSTPFCKTCGDQIPHKRQIALPGVRTCIDCQTAKEAR